MATTRRVSRTRAAAMAPAQPTPDFIHQRVQFEYVDINDITPYDWNPRDNADAVSAVANSISSFGFIVPVVLDSDNVLVAGHTRIEAAKQLGIQEAPVIRASYLTQAQLNAFRVIDNKVAEQAKWDFELLAGEIGKLDSLGLDWTQFGWQQTELDCMSQLVAADCLSVESLIPAAEHAVSTGTQTARRGPRTARIVIGEIVFFVPIQEYSNWVDGIRQLHNFNEDSIARDLKQRLGILDV